MTEAVGPRFLVEGKVVDRAALSAVQRRLESALGEHRRALLHTVDPILLNAAVLMGRAQPYTLIVVPGHLGAEDFGRMAVRHGCGLLVSGTAEEVLSEVVDSADPREARPSLGLFTSGTSGPPKLVLHDWERIGKAARHVPARLRRRNWLMCYAPASFAGIQVLLAAVESEGFLHYTQRQVEQLPRVIVERHIEIVSATPTFWRMLMHSWREPLPRPRLLQATLGGEPAGQDLLDAIRDFFRPDRITHIYASTEAGSVVAVSDGKEGFPRSWLSKPGPVQMRVRNGLLEVRSSFAMRGYGGQRGSGAQDATTLSSWITTPDLVEIHDDRVLFVGRADGMINVGGLKIAPEKIELAINSLEAVRDSVVYGKKNPITGELLAADVMVAKPSSWSAATLKEALREKLDRHLVPQHIRVVDAIDMTDHGKRIRRR